MSGFVLIHRQILEDTAFRSDAEAMAFAWLVLRASWKPCNVRYKDRSISLQRGDLAISVRDMAERLDRSKDWAKRFLDRLTNRDMIKITTATGVNIISICNYDKYQAEIDRGATGPRQSVRQDRDSTATQNNEGNKGTRDIEPNGPISQPASEAEMKPAKRKAVKGAKLPFPENFIPQPFGVGTRSRLIVDGWPDGRINTELERFAANHRARGTVMSDWQSAWSTWVLNTEKFGKPNYGNGFSNDRPEPVSHNTMVQAIVARRAERAGGEQPLFQSDAGGWP